ncbi:MAG: hypothetical protein HONBIEJF_01022 [Fimbriimonadaceae bacterium]|nr:hypothetical protein [Fimbriimonadaceae bacterium]
MNRSRVAVIVLFAIAGAVGAALAAPYLLQQLFEYLKRLNMTPAEFEAFMRNPRPETPYAGATNPASIFAIGLLGLLLGAFIGSVFHGVGIRIGERWDQMRVGDKVTLFLGIFAGIVMSMPFLILFLNLGRVVGPLLTVGFILGLSSIAIYALKSMEEFLPWQRNAGPARKSGKKILDTNIIIDGRIYDVVRCGFLEGQIYVPNFVLEELQHIADSADAMRRQRGRRGLEVLRHLQNDYQIDIGSQDRYAGDAAEDVDARLVKLAKALGADIVTNDFNLNRVARLQNVNVLNVNDLALAMKPNVLPSESLMVQILREGNQPGQGVGYLDDGTMVVVEQGRRAMGETVEVTVTQVIQTERGKMIFGDIRQQRAEA